jgi:hypothetical protein
MGVPCDLRNIRGCLFRVIWQHFARKAVFRFLRRLAECARMRSASSQMLQRRTQPGQDKLSEAPLVTKLPRFDTFADIH